MDREKQEIAGALPYLFPLTKGSMRRKRRKTLEKEIGSLDLEIKSADFNCAENGANYSFLDWNEKQTLRIRRVCQSNDTLSTLF